MSAQELVNFSRWLLTRTGNNDPADDRQGGGVVERENANNNPWFLPGTWGQVNVPTRRIHVPDGASLLVVAGSSHATDKERGRDILAGYANWGDGLWGNSINLTLNGNNQQLRTVTTESFNVDIQNDNYLQLTRISRGPTNMVTIGHVFRHDNPVVGDVIAFGGNSRQDNSHGNNGEGAYNLQVRYELI